MSNTPSNDASSSPNGQPEPLNPNGLQAFETLSEFLDEDGWHPQRVDDRFVYRTAFTGEHSTYRCFAQIAINRQQFLFYVSSPVFAPEELRPAVAEFITRANYGMRIGNFELDYSDGEMRYKSAIDFEGDQLSSSLIRHAIYPAVLTMDHYFPGLMSVIYGGRTPFEAIEEIESQPSSSSAGASGG